MSNDVLLFDESSGISSSTSGGGNSSSSGRSIVTGFGGFCLTGSSKGAFIGEGTCRSSIYGGFSLNGSINGGFAGGGTGGCLTGFLEGGDGSRGA